MKKISDCFEMFRDNFQNYYEQYIKNGKDVS
jgi:hypothetical protein